MSFMHSTAKCAENYEAEKKSQFDPNPSVFSIIKIASCNRNVAIVIKYPNCKNYEGDKIIVYRNVAVSEVLGAREIDPHFKDAGKLKPFARFEPTDEGWDKAMWLLKII